MSRTTSRWVFALACVAALLLAPASALAGGGGSPNVLVVGTVKDGSGHGWPLYATVAVTGETFPHTTLYTDPQTGYYSIELPAGADYEFEVTSLVPGYNPGGGTLALPAASVAAAMVRNWTLAAAPTCSAPGYAPGSFTGPLVLSESFDGGAIPATWSVDTVGGASWTIYTLADICYLDNNTGGSGPFPMVNSSCEAGADTSLVTASMDLTGRTTAAVQWANDYITDEFEPSLVRVDVTTDGGFVWKNIWTADTSVPGPGTQIADLSFAAGQPDVRVRFHYQSGFFSRWWQVDDVKVGTFVCPAIPGGLVAGTVSDANSGLGLTGATIENATDGGSTTSLATPQNTGFYAIFADGGSKTFEASYPAYVTGSKTVTVVPNATTLADFSLTAGILSASPRPLQAFIAPETLEDQTVTLNNAGTAPGAYRIQEVGVPPVPDANPVAATAAQRRESLMRARELTLGNVGQVVSSFPTGLSYGFGLVYDTTADRLWIANPSYPPFGIDGDGLEHQFLPDGTDTGETIDIHDTGGLQQADGTYNGRTGMLWQINFGGDNCLFEMDPVTKVVTGKKICGTPDTWDTNLERALAYDYATDTYYVSGTNNPVIYHIDAAGNLLDSADIGIPSVGFAYNPTTRHLFALTQGAAPFDVWVIDPQADYAVLGGFRVTDGGVPVLQFDATSLEADCSGRLWLNTTDADTVYSFESGETGWCVNQISWLSEDPTEGVVPASGGDAASASLPVTVTFDSRGLLPGLRQGSLLFATDTPSAVDPIPVDLTVMFNDVPQGVFAWNFIYGAAGAGVMPGCAPQAPISNFCRNEIVTRRSMAAYIERAMHGALTPPPVYLGEFQDVRSDSINANYIQGLVNDGITAGCSVAPPLYCPDSPVTRAQMAVFIWKALHGTDAPPSCSIPAVFGDVPCPGGFAVDYIEAIYNEGVTVGCGGGDYCPDAGITNSQMAVYLVKAFHLAYLP